MEKKNTGLIISVAILSLLTLGLGGYIVYDNFITDNEIEEKEQCPECLFL